MKASDLFVKALENEGVEYIFGLPGEENLDFLNSLKNSKIKFVLTRHEQAAGFMAATYGRLTGKAGVCLSTLGPGATNLVTAAAYSNLGAMPMVMITGQKPLQKNKQGRFQIVNTVETMRPLTKMSKQIQDGFMIPSIIRNSFKVAEEERPGAVLIELPEDIAREDVDRHSFFPTWQVRRPVAEEKAINRAIEMIEEAKKPLILVGAGGNRKQVSKMLLEFMEKTKIPYFTTQMGKGAISPNPFYIGTAAVSENDYVHEAIDKTDLIINVGHDVVEKPPFFMRVGKIKAIHINFSSARVSDSYFPQLEVVGDIANAIWQIKEKIKPQKTWDFSDFLKVRNLIKKDVYKNSKSYYFPLIPQKIVSDVNGIYRETGIVCLDNGMYKLWFARNYKTYVRNSLLLDNALATMGAGLPSAIAAKIVHPEKKVLAVAGDGGFMMNSQEIETAVRLKLDLVVLVLTDNCYGMIRWKQSQMEQDNFGLEFNNPDFVKYAESYGAKGYRVEKVGDLKRLLDRCSVEKGVHVIDVPVSYEGVGEF